MLPRLSRRCGRAAPADEERPREVHRDDAVPVGGRDLVKAVGAQDGGHVDEDVEPSEALDAARDRGLDGRFVAHVADPGSDVGAGGAQRGLELRQRLLLHVDGEQPGALGGQPLGNGAADAGSGAGDENDTVLEAGHGAGP